MADIKGFLKYGRELPDKRPASSRIKDYKELYTPVPPEHAQQQAARCMDCGVPFCHNGCPLGNIIPAFNDAVYREDWLEAFEILSSTNNFPEFTGRICPAPCEQACVLGINTPPVTIEHIEKSIAEIAFERGYIRPKPPATRTGKKVAIVGSGPAGLAAAAQLNKAGHFVTVLERDDRIGGLLRYGIPDFKLEKWVVERRIAIMEAEGVRFRTNAHVGVNVPTEQLQAQFDAILLAGGATVPRDLGVPGRELKGVHFAMDFLKQSNQRVAGDTFEAEALISAKAKNVVVIGGGDTGSDCMGTSHRQGAASVTQLELLGKPPAQRDASTPWPMWPLQLRTSTSHEEGGKREWAVMTKAFLGDENGQLRAIQLVDVEWKAPHDGGRPQLLERPDSLREIPCELALLAVGFLHGEPKGLVADLEVALDARGNIQTTDYATSVEGVFAAGDVRRGQSLVVWAIAEGREAAAAIDRFLIGETALDRKEADLYLMQ